MNALLWWASALGGGSALASWLGMVNKGEETASRVRWWASVALAGLGVVLFAGVVAKALYETAGAIPWVATVARLMAWPARKLTEGVAQLRGGAA